MSKPTKSLDDEIIAAYDAIFPFVPEACDEEGAMLSVAQKIEIMADEFLATRSTLRKLVEAAKSKEFDKRSNGGAWCSSCSSVDGWTIPKHAPVCPYADAIAEAERLLGDAT